MKQFLLFCGMILGGLLIINIAISSHQGQVTIILITLAGCIIGFFVTLALILTFEALS